MTNKMKTPTLTTEDHEQSIYMLAREIWIAQYRAKHTTADHKAAADEWKVAAEETRSTFRRSVRLALSMLEEQGLRFHKT